MKIAAAIVVFAFGVLVAPQSSAVAPAYDDRPVVGIATR